MSSAMNSASVSERSAELKQRYLALCAKVDALSKRERVIVFAVALVFVYGLVQLTLLDPLLEQSARLDKQDKEMLSQIESLQQEQVLISAEIKAGPNRVKKRELEGLEEQLERVDGQLRDSTVALIPPRLMPEVMQEVLSEIKGLRLVHLENRPAVPLTKVVDEGDKADSNSENATTTNALYRHGFVLTLEGSYQATMNFFKELENKPWKFFWQELRYEVVKFPKAKIILEVHTLSTEADWIGV